MSDAMRYATAIMAGFCFGSFLGGGPFSPLLFVVAMILIYHAVESD